MWHRKNASNEQRIERWRREDAAPRLLEHCPTLQSLQLSLKIRRGDAALLGADRIQHVIVARAGARFEFPCSDPKCQEGGYDVTREILRSLTGRRESFEGSISCPGMVGNNECRCSLVFVGRAVYTQP